MRDGWQAETCKDVTVLASQEASSAIAVTREMPTPAVSVMASEEVLTPAVSIMATQEVPTPAVSIVASKEVPTPAVSVMASKEVPTPAVSIAITQEVPAPVALQTRVLESLPSPLDPTMALTPSESSRPEVVSEAAVSTLATNPAEPKQLSPAARTKLLLAQSMASRRAKAKQALPEEPLPTPARSNSLPPDVKVLSPKPDPTGRVAGTEKEVQAIADRLSDEDDAVQDDVATKHYSDTEWTYEHDDESEEEVEMVEGEMDEMGDDEPRCEDEDRSDECSCDDARESDYEPEEMETLMFQRGVVEEEVTEVGVHPKEGGAWLAADEVARRFGRPAHWGQRAIDFLNPDVQQVPKPRGRKAKKGKGSKKSKGSKGAKVDDEEEFEASAPACAEPSSSRKRAASKPGPKPKKMKVAPTRDSSPEPEHKVKRKVIQGSAKAKTVPKAKRAAKAKCAPKSAAKAKAKSPKPKSAPKANPKTKPANGKAKGDDEYKDRMSRKSGAYHAAFKLARSQGKTEEDCRALAREVTKLKLNLLPHIAL